MPVLGVLFDYLENVATSLVMLRYPAQTPVVDVLAPALTMAKWVLIYVSFVLLLVGAIVAVWKWRKRLDRQ
jgi:membrane protein implicated in regulation of membrane protease activity